MGSIRESVIREMQAALFIVDEIQSGCGRTGKFFSFEHFGITPDIVCLSKSLSGFGIPMSMLLMKQSIDKWEPGEHNGTFRGTNYGFITGAEALKVYWSDNRFEKGLINKINFFHKALLNLTQGYHTKILSYRALGLFAGLVFKDEKTTKAVQNFCFRNGLIIEVCGPDSNVLKFLPPINIDDVDLASGISIIENALKTV
ncbi:aminotransferase class III-fold pyridoxal phosphate-dependent enzyme [Thiofilum flexile]|uniref:aminotransferase class III-fold pyridoxal phosphate-dependent enzyme n=1 Tax=Thiofilum flexile TaxID=125627 RepID=UPI00036B034D|nr:aminotransferase class III-fold pyridoxal phosphate-dependent enzyme [Thiofilum flexile]